MNRSWHQIEKPKSLDHNPDISQDGLNWIAHYKDGTIIKAPFSQHKNKEDFMVYLKHHEERKNNCGERSVFFNQGIKVNSEISIDLKKGQS